MGEIRKGLWGSNTVTEDSNALGKLLHSSISILWQNVLSCSAQPRVVFRWVILLLSQRFREYDWKFVCRSSNAKCWWWFCMTKKSPARNANNIFIREAHRQPTSSGELPLSVCCSGSDGMESDWHSLSPLSTPEPSTVTQSGKGWNYQGN